jgi:hypothetical protein
MKGIGPASRASRAATLAWIAAAVTWTAALVAEDRAPIALGLIVLAAAGALGLVALSRRRKAAVAPGSFYASSADLVDARTRRRRRLPGELSITDTAIYWNPSAYSVRKGAEPIEIGFSERPDVVFEAGPGLAGLSLRIRRLDGSELSFITHRSGSWSSRGSASTLLGAGPGDLDRSARAGSEP